MPRKSKTAVEEGYLRSFWEELEEIAREHAGVCTVLLYPTKQRGVFTVEVRALVLSGAGGGDPLTHTVTRRLPDGGSLPFAGSLWWMANKLSNLVEDGAERSTEERKPRA